MNSMCLLSSMAFLHSNPRGENSSKHVGAGSHIWVFGGGEEGRKGTGGRAGQKAGIRGGCRDFELAVCGPACVDSKSTLDWSQPWHRVVQLTTYVDVVKKSWWGTVCTLLHS